MFPELPAPIAAYFVADRGDGDAVAACFTPDGFVRDEGRLHEGRAAIRAWKQAASAAFRYVSTPTSVAREGGVVLVSAHVAGDFPGSPVDLRYRFTLEGDAIAALEIAP